jgi:hypothetical protein
MVHSISSEHMALQHLSTQWEWLTVVINQPTHSLLIHLIHMIRSGKIPRHLKGLTTGLTYDLGCECLFPIQWWMSYVCRSAYENNGELQNPISFSWILIKQNRKIIDGEPYYSGQSRINCLFSVILYKQFCICFTDVRGPASNSTYYGYPELWI